MRLKTEKQGPQGALFSRLGKIKIGEKLRKKGANGETIVYPSSTDYFVFTSDVGRRIQRVQDLLMKIPENAEAGKIVVIPCTFASNDESDTCSQFLELRDKNGQIVAKGDGETFYESTSKGYEMFTPEEPAEYMASILDKNKGSNWRECLVLRVVILGFEELGTWEFRTYGAETTIPSIVATYDGIKELAGRVRGIPFRLTVTKQKSNRANTNRQYPVVNLFCDFSPEGLDRIRDLGGQLTGLITPAKLDHIEPAQLGPASIPDLDTVDAEIIEEDAPKAPPADEHPNLFTGEDAALTSAQLYVDNFDLETLEDFNAAKDAIRNGPLTEQEKSKAAVVLGAKAKDKWFVYDKATGSYIQDAPF